MFTTTFCSHLSVCWFCHFLKKYRKLLWCQCKKAKIFTLGEWYSCRGLALVANRGVSTLGFKKVATLTKKDIIPHRECNSPSSICVLVESVSTVSARSNSSISGRFSDRNVCAAPSPSPNNAGTQKNNFWILTRSHHLGQELLIRHKSRGLNVGTTVLSLFPLSHQTMI